MRSVLFVAVVLVSGAIAGTAYGMVNMVTVEPMLDIAIELEEGALLDGSPQLRIEYDSYRDWQKGGHVMAGLVFGVSMGALYGIVYAYSRGSLPGSGDISKALLLAGVMWTVLVVVPSLKYPAGLPGMGDPGTVEVRSILYTAFVVISGAGAIAAAKISGHLAGRRKFLALAAYGLLVGAAWLAMPDFADSSSLPPDLIMQFQAMSVVSLGIFWIVAAVSLGVLWRRFRPDRTVSTNAL